jgi:DNA repair/transcription protein MET18/MMS19
MSKLTAMSGVNDSSVPLLDVVKALGEYLTSTEDDVRLKGAFLALEPRMNSLTWTPGLTFLTNLVKVISSNRINRQASESIDMRLRISLRTC